MKAKVNKVTIEVKQLSIFALNVDAVAIGTSTNLVLSPEQLEIFGPEVQAECTQIAWCDVGSAIITNGGQFKGANKVIHAVGPKWGDNSARGKLGNATWHCLELAEENNQKTIALPALSVGELGYPVENCARIMLEKTIDFTFEKLKSLRHVIFYLRNENIMSAFIEEFERQLNNLRESGDGKVHV